MLALVFKTDCAYPRWTSAVFLPQNCFILVLFIDFYIKNYIRKPQAQNEKKATELSNCYEMPSSGISENISKTTLNELKTLSQALNAFNNGTYEEHGIFTPQNETQSSEYGSHQLQNGTNRSNGSRISQIGSHYSEHGPITSYNINNDGKHEKSE